MDDANADDFFDLVGTKKRFWVIEPYPRQLLCWRCLVCQKAFTFERNPAPGNDLESFVAVMETMCLTATDQCGATHWLDENEKDAADGA